MIQFKNVTKKFDSKAALCNVTFSIAAGEFVFLVGASGAGKSTVIKLLLKELEPTDGFIFVENKDINKLDKRFVPLYRRRIGFVFQDFRLLSDRTAFENVAFAMEVAEATKKEIKKAVPNALGLVGLSSKAHLFPQDLSGGEQQRVSLARAIVNMPSVVIADEPTGNLDPHTAREIISVLNSINRKGTTVIVATHAKDIVNSMQKRVIELENGVVIRDRDRDGYYNEV